MSEAGNHQEIDTFGRNRLTHHAEDSLFSAANRQVVETFLKAHPDIRLHDRSFAREDYFCGIDAIWQATATVGLAVDIDELFTIGEVLHQLNDAAKFEDFETVIGVHADWVVPVDGHEVARQFTKYEKVVSYLRGIQYDLFPNVTLRMFLTFIKNCTDVKASTMLLQSIITESIAMGRKTDYPVVHLTPESIAMRKKTIATMTGVIRNKEAHVVRVPTSLSFDKGYYYKPQSSVEAMNPIERQATMVALIYTRTRELIESQLDDTEDHIFDTEGMKGAGLLDWMHMFIVSENSSELLEVGAEENNISKQIARTALSRDIAPLRYADPQEAKQRLSHRRLKELAMTLPPWQLPLHLEKSGHGLHMSEPEKVSPQRYTIQDILTMIGVMFLRQEQACGREIVLPYAKQLELKKVLQHAGYGRGESFLHANWITQAKHFGEEYLQKTAEEKA